MKFVDLHAQYLSLKDELDGAIQTVIKQSAFIRGVEVDDFEENYAAMMGVKHCVSCANGTDALYIALKAMGVELGDEVITTAHSWISTSETITQAGGRVVFCDTEDEYYCIDAKQIESHITDKTKGIVVVHLYGQPAAMDAIMEISRRHNLWVIEDCAQAHLAEYNGRRVGTIGDVGTFSFYPGKNLGAMGDAGCLVTNRECVAKFSTLFARHGGKNNHVIEGINSRMDGIQAAVLNVKMTKLNEWTEQRIQLARYYSERLSKIEHLTIPKVRDQTKPVYHLYVIRSRHRDELRKYLTENDIPTVINYSKALPNYSAYKYLNIDEQDFPIAKKHATQILSIPMHPFLSIRDQDLVIDSVIRFEEKSSAYGLEYNSL